jgi:putative protein kinase ArgK-like GTPase of G3E family
LEVLFIVISVIVAIINYAAKQQQEHNKQQGRTKRQQPIYRTGPPPKLEGGIQELWSKIEKGLTDLESEGLEAEDRSRTGSLEYLEMSQSEEGTCDEHPFHMEKKAEEAKKPNRPAPANAVADPIELEGSEEGISIVLTEEHLLSSFIMAEIIGPPRALKRSVR